MLREKNRIEKQEYSESKQEGKLRKKPGLLRGIQHEFPKKLLKRDIPYRLPNNLDNLLH
jgi:hypothetical protein